MTKPNEVAEALRLAELYQLAILDTQPEEGFEAVVDLGVSAFNCSSCIVSFVDSDRQWFKARRGFNSLHADETPRDISICTHTIKKDEPMVIPDCTQDDRVKDSPLVTGSPWIRAYLGVPVKTPTGARVGSFCLIDTSPRNWSSAEIKMAKSMAALVEVTLSNRQQQTLHTNSRAPIFQSGHRSDFAAHEQAYASWRRHGDESFVALSPNLEDWLCLSQSPKVSWAWFNSLIVREHRHDVELARELGDGKVFQYQIQLHNGRLLTLKERTYKTPEEAGEALAVGLLQNVATSAQLPRIAVQSRPNPLDTLKTNTLSFLAESTRGKFVLDLNFKLVQLGQVDDTELHKVKDNPSVLEFIYEEDRDQFIREMETVLGTRLKKKAFARIRLPDSKPIWTRFVIERPATGIENSRKALVLQYTKMVNESTMVDRNLFDQTLLGITEKLGGLGTWFYHVDSGLLKVSDQFKAICKARELPLGSIFELTELLTRLTGKNMASTLIECINNRQATSVECEVDFDGLSGHRWFRFSFQPISNGLGSSSGLYGAVEDITHTKHLAQELSRKSAELNQVLNALTDGTLELDEALQIEAIDAKARHLILGRDPFIHQAAISDVLPELDTQELRKRQATLRREGTATDYEFFNPKTDRWLRFKFLSREDGLTILLRDITQRKAMYRDLFMVGSAIEQINEVIMVTNDLGSNATTFQCIYLNSAFENVTGQAVSKWLGRNPYPLIADRLPLRDFRKLLVHLLKREKLTITTRYETDAGAHVPCEILVSPFVDKETGTPWSLIVFRPSSA